MHDFHGTFRDLLHASNLRHGTDGFTSLPKEGVLRIFSPLKIRRIRPGLNPRTWVPKASTLPLDHRSRLEQFYMGSKSCYFLSGVRRNCLRSRRTRSLYLSIRRTIKRIVVIIGAYHYCQLRTKFFQQHAVKVNFICRGNYLGSSVWISTQQVNIDLIF